jgi:hypothetical protein
MLVPTSQDLHSTLLRCKFGVPKEPAGPVINNSDALWVLASIASITRKCILS